MPDSILSHEPVIRLAAFAGILTGMAAWGLLAPRRDFPAGCLRRWPNNYSIVVLDTLLVRLAFPLTAAGLLLQPFRSPQAPGALPHEECR